LVIKLSTKNFTGTTCAPISPPVGRVFVITRSILKKTSRTEYKNIDVILKGFKLDIT
jgi:hypothetical protein